MHSRSSTARTHVRNILNIYLAPQWSSRLKYPSFLVHRKLFYFMMMWENSVKPTFQWDHAKVEGGRMFWQLTNAMRHIALWLAFEASVWNIVCYAMHMCCPWWFQPTHVWPASRGFNNHVQELPYFSLEGAWYDNNRDWILLLRTHKRYRQKRLGDSSQSQIRCTSGFWWYM